LARYRLDVVGVKEMRWGKGGKVKPGNYILFSGKGNENNQMETGVLVHDGILSAGKSVELVRDTVSCIGLIGRWCDITVLSAQIPTEEKSYVWNYSRFSIIFLSII
jgi:hypothetical protein